MGVNQYEWVYGPELHAVLLQLGQICTECALRHGGNSGLDQGTSILLLGCNLFLLFTLRKPGFRKGNGLLDGGEPNHISWRDLYPGLAEVVVEFNA